MNSWRMRLHVALLITAFWVSHSVFSRDIPNDVVGMLVFHGSAALLDAFIIFATPLFLSGKLCDDIQVLCLLSIIANFIGWIAYVAYVPPHFYNAFMLGLSFVQYFRLLFDRSNGNYVGRHLVRGVNHMGA